MDRTSVLEDSSEGDFSNSVSNEGLHGTCKLLTEEGKRVLDKQQFGSCDFWRGFKLYCYARYSQCPKSRGRFHSSKMGQVLAAMYKRKPLRWGSAFDEGIRQVWAQMEEYGEVFHGQDWRNLRDLMEEFDDVKKLSASENGCLLMKLVEDDEQGTERLYSESQAVQVRYTNIFDELRGRLNTARSNLESLRDSSGQSSNLKRNRKRKRRTGVLRERPNSGKRNCFQRTKFNDSPIDGGNQ